MALLPNTRLETHEAGLQNLAGIINGDWKQIEKIFNPALTAPDPVWLLPMRAFLRSSAAIADGAQLVFDPNVGKFIARPGFTALVNSGTININFKAGLIQRPASDLSVDTVFTFSGLIEGFVTELIIKGDATGRALTWPASIIWMQAMPTAIPAGKVLLVKFRATTTASSGVVASWEVQP